MGKITFGSVSSLQIALSQNCLNVSVSISKFLESTWMGSLGTFVAWGQFLWELMMLGAVSSRIFTWHLSPPPKHKGFCIWSVWNNLARQQNPDFDFGTWSNSYKESRCIRIWDLCVCQWLANTTIDHLTQRIIWPFYIGFWLSIPGCFEIPWFLGEMIKRNKQILRFLWHFFLCTFQGSQYLPQKS